MKRRTLTALLPVVSQELIGEALVTGCGASSRNGLIARCYILPIPHWDHESFHCHSGSLRSRSFQLFAWIRAHRSII